MLADSLMVVLSHPEDVAREAEFNEWYTGSHIPDVLHSSGFVQAMRFKHALTIAGEPSPYLALYQIDSDDIDGVNNTLLTHLGTDEPMRIPMPPGTRDVEGGLVQVDTWAYFSKRLEAGHNDASPENAPKAVLITMTDV